MKTAYMKSSQMDKILQFVRFLIKKVFSLNESDQS